MKKKVPKKLSVVRVGLTNQRTTLLQTFTNTDKKDKLENTYVFEVKYVFTYISFFKEFLIL
jgi:uncharacterized protein YifN (PemK superfamily)